MIVQIGFGRNEATRKFPVGNYIIIMLATLTFAIQMLGDPHQQCLDGLILERLSLSSVLGHMWLHMSGVHIVGNLITLWIFGRHICLKIGHANYLLAYFCLGAIAAAVHFFYDGRPAIGASGAIMGVLGMHVVICFRHFGILGPWLILTWFLLNLIASIIGNYPTTYVAHVGGFVAGIILANILIILNVAKCDATDQSLVRLLRPSISKTSAGECS